MLTAGLSNLKTLRARANEELKAANPHELYRCLEVLNLLEIAETIIASARERRETRFPPEHERIDFLQQDDDRWKVFLAIRKKENDLLFSKRKIDNALC
jgi:succinate dehydrogenase/fumarate reductase flavoprotein subunit